MDDFYEHEAKMELMLENLITIIGRSNRKLDELSNRVKQLERFIHEAALQDSHDTAEGSSFMKRVK